MPALRRRRTLAPPRPDPRRRPLLRVILVFLTGVAGISFAAIFVRLALPAPPVITGFYRMLFGTLLVGAYLLWRGRPIAASPRHGLLALASGVCFGTDHAIWNTSLVHTTVANSTLLVNTTPLYVGLWSLLVLRQRLHPRFVVGAALALAGAAMLLGVSWGDGRHLFGDLLALAAAVLYTGYLLLMSAARREAEVVDALFLASAGATLTLGGYGLAAGNAFVGFPAHSWLAFAGAALVSQVGGVFAIIWALRYLPATTASVALLGQPVGAALLAWWLLGEPLSALQSLGALAVLAGIALAAAAQAPGARAERFGRLSRRPA
ncbi:MAG: DMT family transporter [Myxococcota bacterium]